MQMDSKMRGYKVLDGTLGKCKLTKKGLKQNGIALRRQLTSCYKEITK